MDVNTNFEREKTWHELYREEQERKNREKNAQNSKFIGLILLIVGVVCALSSTVWSVYHSEDFVHGPKDILRAEHAGQRAYAYMIFMSPAMTQNGNTQVRYVVDRYGYTAVVFIHENDAAEYEQYQDDINLYYYEEAEEDRLEGYAKAYDAEDKEFLREYLATLSGCTPEEIDDEIMVRYFGEYYLQVDEFCEEKVMVFRLFMVLGILLGISGALLYTGKMKYVQGQGE